MSIKSYKVTREGKNSKWKENQEKKYKQKKEFKIYKSIIIALIIGLIIFISFLFIVNKINKNTYTTNIENSSLEIVSPIPVRINNREYFKLVKAKPFLPINFNELEKEVNNQE